MEEATERVAALREALAERVVVADGAMGTMLQASDATLEDFEGHEGCNEILNVTRPDIVRGVHEAYLEVGADCVEHQHVRREPAATSASTTSPSGSSSCPRPAPGSPARPPTTWPRRGPAALGARLDRPRHQAAHPRPRHASRRCATPTSDNAAGLLRGGADALIVETCQDLLQAKAAVIGARRAMADGRRRTCRSSLR